MKTTTLNPGYIWYSFGSDESGPALAKALGFDSGKKTPKPENYEVIIGWGCKEGSTYKRGDFQKQVTMGRLRLLNSVESVGVNRQKLEVLRILHAAKVPVPGYVVLTEKNQRERQAEVEAAIATGTIAFPVLGFNALHKGDPHICPTIQEVAHVLSGPTDAVDYFRSFCPGTEYRIHVLRDTALIAQEKQMPADPAQAFVESLAQDLKRKREKSPDIAKFLPDGVLDHRVLRAILEEAGPEILQGTGQIQRSVSRGWVLNDIPITKVPDTAKSAAIQALDVLGLDLGAVSVSVDGNTARVTNITTAPALSEEHSKIYVQAITEFCARKGSRGVLARPSAKAAAPVEMVAKIAQRLAGLSASTAERILAALEEE